MPLDPHVYGLSRVRRHAQGSPFERGLWSEVGANGQWHSAAATAEVAP